MRKTIIAVMFSWLTPALNGQCKSESGKVECTEGLHQSSIISGERIKYRCELLLIFLAGSILSSLPILYHQCR
jgi:hypothetical protein